MQILYLVIISITTYFVVKSSFAYIPGYYLGETHRYCLHRANVLFFFRVNGLLSIILSWILLDIIFSFRYTSLLAVAVGILLFLLTSFSDPGTIKAENVSQYVSAYPYDNIIYEEKECTTCKFPKWVSYCSKILLKFWSRLNLCINWSFFFFYADLQGQSTAAFVIVVLLALIITVDGWLGTFKIPIFIQLFMWFSL